MTIMENDKAIPKNATNGLITLRLINYLYYNASDHSDFQAYDTTSYKTGTL